MSFVVDAWPLKPYCNQAGPLSAGIGSCQIARVHVPQMQLHPLPHFIAHHLSMSPDFGQTHGRRPAQNVVHDAEPPVLMKPVLGGCTIWQL